MNKEETKFKDYFKQREKGIISAIGEDDWENQKVYFVKEIIEIVNEYLAQSLKGDGEKKRRPCNCDLHPYSKFTPLEKEYGCYYCSRKPAPPNE